VQLIFLGFDQLQPHCLWLKQFLFIHSVVSLFLAHSHNFGNNTNLQNNCPHIHTVCSWFHVNYFFYTRSVLSFSLAQIHILCKEFTLPHQPTTCETVLPQLSVANNLFNFSLVRFPLAQFNIP